GWGCPAARWWRPATAPTTSPGSSGRARAWPWARTRTPTCCGTPTCTWRRPRTAASPTGSSATCSEPTPGQRAARSGAGLRAGASRSVTLPPRARASVERFEELLARARVLAEDAAHGAGARGGALLLDAAHHHAQVARLRDHREALGLQHLHQRVGDLRGHPLLQLQPAREQVDDARELRQPQHALVRHVADGRLAEERQHVVLAQRVELDALDDHHLGALGGEQGAVDHGGEVGVVAGGEEPERARHAFGRLDE